MEIKSSELLHKYLNKNVVTIQSSCDIKRIEEIFKEYKVSHLPVLNPTNDLVGIISKTDYYSFIKFIANETSGSVWTEKQLEHYTAKELMSTQVLSLNIDDEVSRAMEVFISQKYHAIPIMESGSICGIITPHDILKGIMRMSE